MAHRWLSWLTIVLVLTALLPAGAAAQAKRPVVVIETSAGDITVELFPDRAPITVDNFLAYVKSGFYEGTIFHRVIRGFMIQGGGVTADLQRKPTRPPIKNEAANGLKNTRGTIAMARTSEVDSATSQFFINTVDNAFLDHKGPDPKDYGYAVFGRVIAGMEVVDRIEQGKTGPGDVPVEPVLIKRVRIKEGA
jgi:cyclophilin family peptidyl-prolyl cis-trans isomerase